MGIRLIEAPTDEPVTLAEVKSDLRIEHTDDDVKLGRYISQAREWVEMRCQRELALKTWESTIDYFPDNEIILPRSPVSSVVSIKYYDTDGFEQTLNAGEYYLDEESDPGWVFPETGWPSTLDGVNAVKIRFISGYDDYDLIPGPIKSAIRLKIQELYDGDDHGARVDDLLSNYYQLVA